MKHSKSIGVCVLCVTAIVALVSIPWRPAISRISNPHLGDVVFAVTYNSDAFVVNGHGKTLFELRHRQSEETRGKVWDERLTAAALSSDGNRLLIVAKKNYPVDSNTIIESTHDALILVDLEANKDTSLLTTENRESISSPVWFADNNRFAYLRGNKLVLDSLDKSENMEFEIPDSNAKSHDYIRLSNDDQHIFLHFPNRHIHYDTNEPTPNVARFEIATKQLDWYVDPARILQSNPDMVDDEILAIEMIESLFGSKDKFVFDPVHSADRKYYAYKRGTGGFFASSWIECHERETGKTYHVRTYSRSPYRE